MSRLSSILLATAAGICCLPSWAQGMPVSVQGSDPHALQMLRSVVQSELHAAETDHSNWAYRDHDIAPDKNAVYEVVDSPAGGLRRMIEISGRPVDAETRQKETRRLSDFLHDPSAQAKQRKAGLHDDQQARDMLLMLPNAFIWTMKGEAADLVTLAFRPNPDFKPPTYEARVMGLMAGELVIAKADNRIRTLRGALTEDVKFGYGLFGKLRQGGTFDVERREIGPHIWQITETRVHIDGKALLFKTIGQQEDDVKTDWKPSTARSLEDACRQLGVN